MNISTIPQKETDTSTYINPYQGRYITARHATGMVCVRIDADITTQRIHETPEQKQERNRYEEGFKAGQHAAFKRMRDFVAGADKRVDEKEDDWL